VPNLNDLFTAARLFDNRPFSDFQYGPALFWFFSLLLITSFIGKVSLGYILQERSQRLKKRIFSQIFTLGLILAPVGLFLVFAREQAVAFFAMRFFMLFLLILLLALAVYFAYVWLKLLPAQEQRVHAQIQKNKYLPKPKKK